MNDQETQLVTIQVRRVEGEDKGHKVSEVTQEHLCTFLSLDITNIRNECNNLSNKYRASMGAEESVRFHE